MSARGIALWYEGPPGWLWFIALARIGVLVVAAAGGYRLNIYRDWTYALLALYGVAFAVSLLYLLSLKQAARVRPELTWTQVLMDFGIMAATIAFTDGANSLFTFLFVIVILEAALLLGLPQGFIFATMATAFMCLQAAKPAFPPRNTLEWFDIWYRFLIQGLAFYLTAFVSGYWNQRVNRMEQFQRRILDHMNSGFLIADARGLITVMNRAAYAILGLEENTASGQPVQQVLRAAGGGECPVLTALRAGRDFINYDFQAVTGPDQVKLLSITTSHLRAPGNKANGIIASFADLTEMAALRQEMYRQDRLAAIGELAAGLAHELRNPLAAIRGAMDELPPSLHSPQTAQKLAAIAIRESERLNDTVTGFLDFAEHPGFHRELFDLRELATEIKQMLGTMEGQPDLPATSPRIITVLPDVECAVSGNRAQMKRVFTNIAENAIEAMQGKDTLTITISPVHHSYEIRFDDEGPGISPDKVTKVFEPFYTEKANGSGMGLAICMRIITAHDGTIWAASREGGGASIVVRVPAAPRKEERMI